MNISKPHILDIESEGNKVNLISPVFGNGTSKSCKIDEPYKNVEDNAYENYSFKNEGSLNVISKGSNKDLEDFNRTEEDKECLDTETKGEEEYMVEDEKVEESGEGEGIIKVDEWNEDQKVQECSQDNGIKEEVNNQIEVKDQEEERNINQIKDLEVERDLKDNKEEKCEEAEIDSWKEVKEVDNDSLKEGEKVENNSLKEGEEDSKGESLHQEEEKEITNLRKSEDSTKREETEEEMGLEDNIKESSEKVDISEEVPIDQKDYKILKSEDSKETEENPKISNDKENPENRRSEEMSEKEKEENPKNQDLKSVKGHSESKNDDSHKSSFDFNDYDDSDPETEEDKEESQSTKRKSKNSWKKILTYENEKETEKDKEHSLNKISSDKSSKVNKENLPNKDSIIELKENNNPSKKTSERKSWFSKWSKRLEESLKSSWKIHSPDSPIIRTETEYGKTPQVSNSDAVSVNFSKESKNILIFNPLPNR